MAQGVRTSIGRLSHAERFDKTLKYNAEEFAFR
jgi:hypothetical protein